MHRYNPEDQRNEAEELIIEVLKRISDKAYKTGKGFIDVRSFWYCKGIPVNIQKSLINILSNNGLVTIGYDKPYSLEITNPIGVAAIDFFEKNHKMEGLDLKFLTKQIKLSRPNWILRNCFRFKTFLRKGSNNQWIILLATGVIAGVLALYLGTIVLVHFKIIK